MIIMILIIMLMAMVIMAMTMIIMIIIRDIIKKYQTWKLDLSPRKKENNSRIKNKQIKGIIIKHRKEYQRWNLIWGKGAF